MEIEREREREREKEAKIANDGRAKGVLVGRAEASTPDSINAQTIVYRNFERRKKKKAISIHAERGRGGEGGREGGGRGR